MSTRAEMLSWKFFSHCRRLTWGCLLSGHPSCLLWDSPGMLTTGCLQLSCRAGPAAPIMSGDLGRGILTCLGALEGTPSDHGSFRKASENGTKFLPKESWELPWNRLGEAKIVFLTPQIASFLSSSERFSGQHSAARLALEANQFAASLLGIAKAVHGQNDWKGVIF